MHPSQTSNGVRPPGGGASARPAGASAQNGRPGGGSASGARAPSPAHQQHQRARPEQRGEERKVEPAKPNVGAGSSYLVQQRYDILEAIGGGTYGDVFKAKDKETGKWVALKRLKIDEKTESEGMPITAIREIHILRQLEHENIVRLLEVVVGDPEGDGNGDIFMVFEYMEHDLTGLLSNLGDNRRLKQSEVKCIVKQMLTGLHYCHLHNVLHRDLKPANLLLSRDGVLKLADYGLARILSANQNRNYTNKVVTLWYRPPELLLGAARYGEEIDVWSVGCIFAELLSASVQPHSPAQRKAGKAMFPLETEDELLKYIFIVMGYPTESTWPGVSKLPHYATVKKPSVAKEGLSSWLKKLGYVNQDPKAMDLLSKLLCMDPAKRISALAAISHEYFWSEPMPCKPEQLPKVRASMSKESLDKRLHSIAPLPPQQKQQQQPQGHRGGQPQRGNSQSQQQQQGGQRGGRGPQHGGQPPGGPQSNRGPGPKQGPAGPAGPAGPRPMVPAGGDRRGGYTSHPSNPAPPGRGPEPDPKKRRTDYIHGDSRRDPPAAWRSDASDCYRDYGGGGGGGGYGASYGAGSFGRTGGQYGNGPPGGPGPRPPDRGRPGDFRRPADLPSRGYGASGGAGGGGGGVGVGGGGYAGGPPGGGWDGYRPSAPLPQGGGPPPPMYGASSYAGTNDKEKSSGPSSFLSGAGPAVPSWQSARR